MYVYFCRMGKAIPRPDFHRKNGLTCPLDRLQVMTWCLVAIPLILFFTVQFPLLPIRETIFWTVMFVGCWGIGIFMFILATLSDHPLPPITPDHSHNCLYCREVVPSSAKHCRLCNKCRSGFDHHCRFINNCVTEANYLSFFFGCMFLTSTIYIALAHNFYSLHYFLNDEAGVLNRLSKHLLLPTSKIAYWVCFAVVALFNLGIGTPMTVLTVYHIYFQRRSISTYDYLLNNLSEAPQKLQTFCCTTYRAVKVTSD